MFPIELKVPSYKKHLNPNMVKDKAKLVCLVDIVLDNLDLVLQHEQEEYHFHYKALFKL